MPHFFVTEIACMKTPDINQNRKMGEAFFEKLFLNLHEAAAFLDISLSLMYKLSSKNTITKYKRGGKIYFKPEDLVAYIEKGKIEGIDEIKDQVDGILSKIADKG